jgi:hypothetical protein
MSPQQTNSKHLKHSKQSFFNSLSREEYWITTNHHFFNLFIHQQLRTSLRILLEKIQMSHLQNLVQST